MYVYANTDCVVRYGGGRVHLRKGEAWLASDPFVKARPEFFAKAPTVVKQSSAKGLVEQATAAPGERRATKRVG